MTKHLTEAAKQNAREWYGSCTLEELLEIKERLDFVINERRQEDESNQKGQARQATIS